MTKLINGIHHITAMASNPQRNVDFYTGILGLRLVKKTVNFDAPEVYHFYYGNEVGSPGTILTFFPFDGIGRGRQGKGQQTVTSFSIPPRSLDYWMQRLKKFDVRFEEAQDRFTETYIYFEDPDGLGLELVACEYDNRPPFTYGQIPEEHAIRGFYSATLSEEGYERTAGLLTTHMDHHLIAEQGNRFRYSPTGNPGDIIDIICEPDRLRGLSGGGTVHHIAFSTDSDATQEKVREKLAGAGMNITPALDRSYFHSVYFREPGGVLFEVATNPPGFLIDEAKAQLGEGLKLPAWLEVQRAEVEKGLPPVQLPNFQQYKS